MRVNVQKFHKFIAYKQGFSEPWIHIFTEAVTVEQAVQHIKAEGYNSYPIVQPVFKEDKQFELYLRTLQQQARAAFHLQEQEKLEG